MNQRMFINLLLRLLMIVPLLGLVLFWPAGTLAYWQGWLFAAVFSACNVAMTVDLAIRDPKLLERRMRVGPTAEKLTSQKIIMIFAYLVFAAAFVLPALDRRFGWSDVPPALVLLGDLLVVLAYVGFMRVFAANTHGAATVRVEAGQEVISTGPYAVVRHPMYSGVLLLIPGVSLALGSWWGITMLVPVVLVLAWRLLDEEALLARELPGYAAYMQRVRWRLVPGIF